MNGDTWTARLSEYLDDELPPAERAALETHLAACDDCAATLADLRRIVARAGALDDRPPARELWSGIAARIGRPSTPRGRVLRGPWRRVTLTIPQLAAAGLVVAGLGAGTVWMATGGPADGPAGAPVAIGSDSAAPAGDPLVRPAVASSYESAVRDLERVLAEGRDRLDTNTVRVIEESLVTIDRAIARARAALEADPSDPYLRHHLAQTMRRKLDLLRRATDLVAS